MEIVQETIEQKFMVIVSCALVSLVINFIARKNGYYILPKNKENAEISFFDVMGVFLTFFILEFLVVPILALLWISPAGGEAAIDPVLKGWLNYGAIMVVALGILFYVFVLNPHSIRLVWGEGSFKGRNIQNIFMGIITWGIAYPIVVTTGQIISLLVSYFSAGIPPEQVAVQQLRKTLETPLLYWCMVTTVIFVVPVIEETLFRGFLQTWIKKHLGRLTAIFITAFVFASFHYSPVQGIGNFELLGSLFVLASFLGFIYERQQSLWASIGLHATFNAISIMMISSGE